MNTSNRCASPSVRTFDLSRMIEDIFNTSAFVAAPAGGVGAARQRLHPQALAPRGLC